ncbi:MAG: hypothetical protein ABII80_03860 [bacterium]
MEKTKYKLWMIRHYFGLRAGVVALIAVMLLGFVVRPIFTNVKQIQSQIETEAAKEKSLSEKVSLLSGMDQEVLKERVKLLDKALPPDKDVVLYLSTLDGLSRELGLSFNSIKLVPGEVTSGSEATASAQTSRKISEGLQSLDTEIKISGSQESIYTFLRTVEESVPLMQINDVKINRISSDQNTLSLKLGMLWASFDPKAVKGVISLFNQQEEQYFQKLLSYPQYSSELVSNDQDLGSLGKDNVFEGITPQQ